MSVFYLDENFDPVYTVVVQSLSRVQLFVTPRNTCVKTTPLKDKKEVSKQKDDDLVCLC